MKLASTWCVLDHERVCSELNELFFLKEFMDQVVVVVVVVVAPSSSSY